MLANRFGSSSLKTQHLRRSFSLTSRRPPLSGSRAQLGNLILRRLCLPCEMKLQGRASEAVRSQVEPENESFSVVSGEKCRFFA